MSTKTFALDSIGDVTVSKRRGNRHLRLTVAPSGRIRVSIPTWAPYQAGLDFAVSKEYWITKQLPKPTLMTPNQRIGRTHKLVFQTDKQVAKPSVKIKDNNILISHSPVLTYTNPAVQQAAERGAIRALRQQAEAILPLRLAELADKYQLEVSSVKIRRLSRRWGSCDRNHNIVLNLFMVQLPDELIDYVILHELTHTCHLNHGSDFWARLEQLVPEARKLKKQLATYHPGLISLSDAAI